MTVLTPKKIRITLRVCNKPNFTSNKTAATFGEALARLVTADTNNCSADQIIGALSALIMLKVNVKYAFLEMLKRLGFAQNYRDGLNDSTHVKIPDFMFFRAMPLFCRAHWAFYPFALIFDLYLILLVLGDWVYLKTDKDPADINNTLLTLAVCKTKMPTPWSLLACWLWPKLRPNIYQWLVRYHRPEAGGNYEVALMWEYWISKNL